MEVCNAADDDSKVRVTVVLLIAMSQYNCVLHCIITQVLSEELAQALTLVREELEEEKRKRQELESVILVSPHSMHVLL